MQPKRFNGPPALHYVEGPPNGRTLVMLHGLGRCGEDFQSLFHSLTPEWHLVALDHRGHGDSERATGHYLVTDYAKDVAKFLTERIPKGAVLYGHSLGAMVALAMAAEVPAIVTGVILEDPPFHNMGRRIAESSWQSLFISFQEIAQRRAGTDATASQLAAIKVRTPSGVTTLGKLRSADALSFSAKCLTAVDPDIFTPVIAGRWLDGYDEPSLFRKVRCPVLLLQGDPECGAALSDADAEIAARSCGSLRRVRFGQTSHLIHHEQPAAVLRAISEFASELKPARS